MNRNRLVMIGIVALALAGFVSFSIYRVLRISMASNQVTTTTAVAAAADIPVGARLQEKDLRLMKMLQTDLPPGVYRTTSEVVGRGVLVPMSKGELVLANKLAAENAGSGLPSLVPAGMRAVSVKVNDVIAVAGFVTPGTRVDVVLTGTPKNNEEPTTTTVLQNVQVLAAGQRLQKNDQGEAQQVTVITLMVNPDDAQKLIMASQEGRIQLALRNPLDTDKPTVPQLKNAGLYRLQPGGSPGVSLAKVRQQPSTHFAKAVQPATPAPYIVEMIRGDKRDLSKF